MKRASASNTAAVFALAGLVGAACSPAAEPRTDGSGDGSGSGAPPPAAGGGPGITIDPSGGPDAPGMSTDCDSVLEVTYRDFNQMHPDFEMPFRGDVVRRTLVEPELGADRKPVFKSSIGCPFEPATALGCANWTVTEPVIASAESFASWYRTSDVNREIPGTIELVETPFGSGQYIFESSAFFPLQATDGFGVTPPGHHLGKNFLFTTEIHVTFGYRAGQKFSFRGDDDVWIFVNGKLAMDLGSMHAAAEGTIDFDLQAAELGITPGNIYAMDVFHAERHTDGSNFKFTTNIGCFVPVVVR